MYLTVGILVAAYLRAKPDTRTEVQVNYLESSLQNQQRRVRKTKPGKEDLGCV